MTQIIPRDLPIFFDEEKHKYTDALDREYISTTTIIGKFVEQKDWKAIAEACANIGSRTGIYGSNLLRRGAASRIIA